MKILKRPKTDAFILNNEKLDIKACLKRQEMSHPFFLYPQDKQAKGTWFSINSFGLIFCLMNERGLKKENLFSRGEIILRLLSCKNLKEVSHTIPNLSKKYNPFFLFSYQTSNRFFPYLFL